MSFKILLINNDGSGFANYTDVRDGMTAGELFKLQLGDNANSQNYLIRVNRERVESSYQLQPNDKVTITPTKIEGA